MLFPLDNRHFITDYRILLEADFLVNAFEDNASIESIQHAKESFFETETGKHILDTMFKS